MPSWLPTSDQTPEEKCQSPCTIFSDFFDIPKHRRPCRPAVRCLYVFHADCFYGRIISKFCSSVNHGRKYHSKYAPNRNQHRRYRKRIGGYHNLLRDSVDKEAYCTAQRKSHQQCMQSVDQALDHQHIPKLTAFHANTAQHSKVPPAQNDICGDGIEDVADADQCHQNQKYTTKHVHDLHQTSLLFPATRQPTNCKQKRPGDCRMAVPGAGLS